MTTVFDPKATEILYLWMQKARALQQVFFPLNIGVFAALFSPFSIMKRKVFVFLYAAAR